jgi:hypothetical protein
MASSAVELRDVVQTFMNELQNTHIPGVQTVISGMESHVQHLSSEAGQWIVAEIQHLEGEWVTHKQALTTVEQGFSDVLAWLPQVLRVIEELVEIAGA